MEVSKGNPYYKMTKKMAELCLCSSVLWKVELASNKIGHLAEAISKQSVEDASWLLLTASSKRQEERNDLNMESLSRKEEELRDLGNSQPIHIVKSENIEGVAKLPSDKEILGSILSR